MSQIRVVAKLITYWLYWILVCVAGLLVDRVVFRGSFLAPGIVSLLETWIGTEGMSLRVFKILTAGILGLIDGILLGLFQWVVLRRHIRGAKGWILATALGFSLGLMTFWAIVILVITGPLPAGSDLDWAFGLGLMDSILTGMTLGFSQYLILTGKIRDANWWVPTMILTMIAMWITRWFINPGASFFVFGIISGIVLMIMVSRQEELLTSKQDKIRQTDFPIISS